MSLLSPPPPVYFMPQRALAAFTAYVTLEESGTDELEITQHPVQTGAAITDHAFVKPASLTMNIAFSVSTGPLAETYSNLLALQSSRLPFVVITGKRSYKNMLITRLSCMTDVQTENILSVSLSMQEIIIVNIETATVVVADRTKQANPGKTGVTEQRGAQQVEPPKGENFAKPQSAAQDVASWIWGG